MDNGKLKMPLSFSLRTKIDGIICVINLSSFLKSINHSVVSISINCTSLRLSPYEWQESEVQDNQAMNMENDFGLLDSLWFGMGTLMQQGSDISPRSISTR